MTGGLFTRARDAAARGRKTKGRKLHFAQARDPSESVQACTVQCTWSFFAPCSANLPTNKCSALVHHVCQINWEDKHAYEAPGCSKYCPSHHEYYQEITADLGDIVEEASAPQGGTEK
jgi:hypothetical protein